MFTSAVKSFIKIMLFAAVISLGTLAHGGREIQSFREWKTSKITEAEVKIKIIKEKIGADDPNYNWNPTDKMEAGIHTSLLVQLEKEELNLSNLKDLGISDYYVGYLLKQSSLDEAIHSVSGKLTAEDIADLMRAYAEQFSSSVKQQSKSASRLDFSQ